MLIKALSNTYIKKSVAQSSELPNNQKILYLKGTVLNVDKFTDIAEESHTKVSLGFKQGDWYIYTPHWEFDYKLASSVAPQINGDDFSQKISKFFTLGEMSRYDKRRIPKDNAVKEKILLLALEMDKIREDWGGPIIITSGYRPTKINAEVGGVSNSRHIFGDAVDIAPAGGKSIYTFQSWLDERWYGHLGYGAKKGFVHIDMRNGKGFMTGGTKGGRWPY